MAGFLEPHSFALPSEAKGSSLGWEKPCFCIQVPRFRPLRPKKRTFVGVRLNEKKLRISGSIQQGNPSSDSNGSAPSKDVHIVKEGESLYRIAKIHGVTMTSLARANKKPIARRVLIRVGEVLVIPHDSAAKKFWNFNLLNTHGKPSASFAKPSSMPEVESKRKERVYIVREGDTVESIALKLGIPIEELRTIIRTRKRSSKQSFDREESISKQNVYGAPSTETWKKRPPQKNSTHIPSASLLPSEVEGPIVSLPTSSDSKIVSKFPSTNAYLVHDSTHQGNIRPIIIPSSAFYSFAINFVWGLALVTPVALVALAKVDNTKMKEIASANKNTSERRSRTKGEFPPAVALPPRDQKVVSLPNSPSSELQNSNLTKIWQTTASNKRLWWLWWPFNKLNASLTQSTVSASDLPYSVWEETGVKERQEAIASALHFFLREEFVSRLDPKEGIKRAKDRFRWWKLTDEYRKWEAIEQRKSFRKEAALARTKREQDFKEKI